MTFKKKLFIKAIVIILLYLLIGWMFLYFILGKLAVPRFPEESLKRALEFVEDEKCVGMSFEECEELFGDKEKEDPVQNICYSVGTFKWMGNAEYVLYIFFDEEDRVKDAMLVEEEEW